MPERLYQLGFDENFQPTVPQHVTPEGFAGLEFDKGEKLGRFVREVRERVCIKSSNDAAQYLLTEVYVPFEDFDQEEMWVLLLDSKCRITHGDPIPLPDVRAGSTPARPTNTTSSVRHHLIH